MLPQSATNRSDSAGNRLCISLRTDSPPTPESNTPMGASLALLIPTPFMMAEVPTHSLNDPQTLHCGSRLTLSSRNRVANASTNNNLPIKGSPKPARSFRPQVPADFQPHQLRDQ